MYTIRLTNDEFISKAKEVHSNKYNYSKTLYIRSKEKVCIICPEHGEFLQRANAHLRGQGCPICATNHKPQNQMKSITQFIKECQEIHGNKYDYSRAKYTGARKKLVIICPEHGEFELTPNSHLNGQGCPKCANKNITTEEFVARAKAIHKNKYSYEKSVYQTSHTPVTITCPTHGDFEQRPCDHIHLKQGCPRCSESKGELLVASILDEMNISYTRQYKLNILDKVLLVDFVFNYNNKIFYIEYNGRQHYVPVEYFGGKLALEKLLYRDLLLHDYCKNNSIILIEVKYDDKNIELTIKMYLE